MGRASSPTRLPDPGITYVDTARGYGHSEERLGRYFQGCRESIVSSTRVGYDVPGQEDWSEGAVRDGVEQAPGSSIPTCGDEDPHEDHVVLVDPVGNEFCVIEAGHNFLAGCGYLSARSPAKGAGTSVCAGRCPRLVFGWDRNEETAVLSRAGGTKPRLGRSAVSPEQNRNRQRFDLASADLEAEAKCGGVEVGRGTAASSPGGRRR